MNNIYILQSDSFAKLSTKIKIISKLRNIISISTGVDVNTINDNIICVSILYEGEELNYKVVEYIEYKLNYTESMLDDCLEAEKEYIK